MQARPGRLPALVVVAWLLCLLAAPFAARAQQSETLHGRIVAKPWSKSTQSYCAQGSDYHVLQLPNGEELVIEGIAPAKLKALENRQVSATGKRVRKTIKPTANPFEQRPVGMSGQNDEFTCEVFAARRIKAE